MTFMAKDVIFFNAQKQQELQTYICVQTPADPPTSHFCPMSSEGRNGIFVN